MFRPPLARELFDRRGPQSIHNQALQKYPQISAIAADVRAAVAVDASTNVEEIIERQQARWDSSEAVRRSLIALRFYLRDLIRDIGSRWLEANSGVTNYSLLIDTVQRDLNGTDVVVVTFNYDTMFEDAAEALGVMRIRRGQDEAPEGYIDDGPWRLFKLHGSVDWYRVTSLMGRHRMMSDRQDAEALSQVPANPSCLTEQIIYGRGSIEQRVLVPAIAAPLLTKNRFECPQPMLDALPAWLAGVDRVLCIGWRAAEANFLSVLSTTLGSKALLPINIVSSDRESAASVADHLRAAGLTKARYGAFSGRFVTFMGECSSRAGGHLLSSEAFGELSFEGPQDVAVT